MVVSSENGGFSIPEAIRRKLHIVPGTKFAVVVDGDTLIYKKIQVLPKEEFEKLADKGEEIARRNKIREEDIEEIIHRHRGANTD